MWHARHSAPYLTNILWHCLVLLSCVVLSKNNVVSQWKIAHKEGRFTREIIAEAILSPRCCLVISHVAISNAMIICIRQTANTKPPIIQISLCSQIDRSLCTLSFYAHVYFAHLYHSTLISTSIFMLTIFLCSVDTFLIKIFVFTQSCHFFVLVNRIIICYIVSSDL